MLHIDGKEILVAQGGQVRGLAAALQSQGVDLENTQTADAALSMLLRHGSTKLSVLIACAGAFQIHQDVTADVLVDSEPALLPVLLEHLATGQLFVRDPGGVRVPPERAAALFKEALTWCAADYSDLLAEFGDLLAARRKK